MSTSVYISGDSLWVCSGRASRKKIRISQLCHGTLPEPEPEPGMEPAGYKERFSDYIRAFWRDNRISGKKAHLVVDASLCQSKRMDVPITGEKDLLHIIRNEFLVTTDGADMLYDYTVLDPGRKRTGGSILAAAITRAAVEDYTEIFKNAGVTLLDIDISISRAICLAEMFPKLLKSTFILGILTGSELMLLLFINGEYWVSNVVPLSQERGTSEAAVEISRQISSMIQFNQAQKTDAAIEAAYLCGLNGTELELTGSMSEFLSIPVSEPPKFDSVLCFGKQADGGDTPLSDYIFAACGLIEI